MTRRYRPFDPFERGPFEPPRELRVPRPPRRFWIGVGLFGVASLIFIFASPIVSLITELQWYNALGFKDIYTTRLVLQTVLFVGSLAITFAYLFANAIIALILSGGAGTQWQVLALFQHASPTGVTDPVLGQDISFYLLSLPFLHSIVNWALGLGFMGTLLVAVLYAWRGDSFDLNFSPLAIAHLSATLAVFAVALAGWLWLGRFD